ncbi:MAG: SGNH/GDSL hydrolase family protein [Gemmatimonadaceae bacterium]|nr:SGNH/GDSL hydrolase family protein [Chitinophagaceae bacterium]
MEKMITYLALGDSYTIGESVPYEENFPNQTTALLRNAGYEMEEPEIVAKTGWTTDELTDAILKTTLHIPYDFVSLLIGVNNQYRGRSVEEYALQFESLLTMSEKFAGGKNSNVFVLSIPDWGVTPYAEGRDRKKIALQIDEFNDTASAICLKRNIHFINITTGSREAAKDLELIAEDHLHPSTKEYAKWALALYSAIEEKIKGEN